MKAGSKRLPNEQLEARAAWQGAASWLRHSHKALSLSFPTGIMGCSVVRQETRRDWEAGRTDLPKQRGKAPPGPQGAL